MPERDSRLTYRMTRAEAEKRVTELEDKDEHFNVQIVDRANGGYAIQAWTRSYSVGRVNVPPRQVIIWA